MEILVSLPISNIDRRANELWYHAGKYLEKAAASATVQLYTPMMRHFYTEQNNVRKIQHNMSRIMLKFFENKSEIKDRVDSLSLTQESSTSSYFLFYFFQQ